MPNIIDQLVTDRIQDDVTRLEYIVSKPRSERTTEEQQELDSFSYKGGYSYKDLNRVGEAVLYLKDNIENLGFVIKLREVKTDWTEFDSPTPQQLEDYIFNVITVVSVLISSIDDLPSTVYNLTVDGANKIEEYLIELYAVIDKMLRNIDLGWAMGIAHTGLYGGL